MTVDLLFAPSAFGADIDIPNISSIYHIAISDFLLFAYYQQSGHAAHLPTMSFLNNCRSTSELSSLF
jgi:hypothetical protein